MTSKSSKSTLSDWLLLGAAALCLTPSAGHGQQASPSPSPKPALGYIRLWNMLPGKTAPSIQLLSGEDKVLTTASAYNYNAGYASVPPGTYTFVVRRAGDTANPLKKIPVLLRGDTSITFLVSEKNGQPAVDLLDDTLDPKKLDIPSQLMVRQFMPGARVTVATREGAACKEIGYGESARIDNLPNRSAFLTMKATGLGPEPKTWTTEADLATARRATLLVVPDPYGRFRPRLAYDGQNGAVLDAALAPAPKP